MPVTTIVLVRHAEKLDASEDSELSPAGKARAEALALALRDLPLDAAYATTFQRTRATVAPVCAARGLHVYQETAAATKVLAAKLAKEHQGQHVLVCGHSNTIPEILRHLGVTEKVTIGDDEFDRLFVVTLTADGPRLLALRYSGVQ
jgi:broad specificity phosphatase PhoE